MMTSYHRRPYIYPEDAYSLAIIKLGSGSNLLGYYMYHGGTNPTAMMPGNLDDGSAVYLNENQRTQATNYNDMPVYFPREADVAKEGEEIVKLEITQQ